MSVTTQSCKAALKYHDSAFLREVEAATGWTRGPWARTRKFKNADGIVCREFANKSIPVAILLIEQSGDVVVARERALAEWDKSFEKFSFKIEDNLNFPDGTDDWWDRFVKPTLMPQDFIFGHGVDDDYGPWYIFQPALSDGWDQELPIEDLFPESWVVSQDCEASFSFYAKGNDQALDVTEVLVALGFHHDRGLDAPRAG